MLDFGRPGDGKNDRYGYYSKRGCWPMTNVINWDVEIAALQDLSVTVTSSHRLAMEAFWKAFQESTEPLAQKVLTARMAAEGVAALENVGALGWSISKRHDEGILRRYLSYGVNDVLAFYKSVEQDALRDVWQLPRMEEIASRLSTTDAQDFERGLVGLQQALRTAARNYLALDGKVRKTYNKIKHGFLVVVRLDKLALGASPPTNWREHVNVITDVAANGDVHHIDLERSADMLEALRDQTEGCCKTWIEAASLVMFMRERALPLT